MRGSESDALAFEALSILDDVFALKDDQQFTEAFLRTALKMLVLPLDTQLALVESDSWKRCDERLKTLADAQKKAKVEPKSLFFNKISQLWKVITNG